MNDIERPPKQFSALTPRLRRLLRVILFAFVLMIWNSLWLLVSTASGRFAGVSTESLVTVWVFLLHVVLGLLLVVPVVVYGFGHLLRAQQLQRLCDKRCDGATSLEVAGCSLLG